MHFNTSYFDGELKRTNLIGIPNNRLFTALNKTNSKSHSIFNLDLILYKKELLEQFECRILSTRCLKLKSGSSIKTHIELNIGYWNNLVRIHLPVSTNYSICFTINGIKVQMNTNESWCN